MIASTVFCVRLFYSAVRSTINGANFWYFNGFSAAVLELGYFSSLPLVAHYQAVQVIFFSLSGQLLNIFLALPFSFGNLLELLVVVVIIALYFILLAISRCALKSFSFFCFLLRLSLQAILVESIFSFISNSLFCKRKKVIMSQWLLLCLVN